MIYVSYKEYLNPIIYQKYFYLFFYISNSLTLINNKAFITLNCILLYVVISVTTNFIIQKLLFLSLCVVRLCFMKRSDHKTLRYNVCKNNFNLNEQSEEKIISCHCQTICSILDLIIFYKSV